MTVVSSRIELTRVCDSPFLVLFRDSYLICYLLLVVFKHAENVEEEFKTRFIYIRLLGETSLQAAIDECHKLLSRLGEPINSSCCDKIQVRSELERVKEAVFADGKHISMMIQMEDSKKIRVMQVMRVLSAYYHFKRSFVIGLVSAKMVDLSMRFGYSEGR